MKYILGIVFLMIGLAGIVLPIIPGVPFLLIAAFFFGFISRKKVIYYVKKFKNKDKNSKINRFINFVLIKYIHGKEPIKSSGKN